MYDLHTPEGIERASQLFGKALHVPTCDPYLLDSGPKRYRSLEQQCTRLHLAQGKRSVRRYARLLRERPTLHEAVLAVALEPACYHLRNEQMADEPIMDVARLVVGTALSERWSLEQIRRDPKGAILAVRALWARLDGRAS